MGSSLPIIHHLARAPKRDHSGLTSVEKKQIVRYLENPVSCGLWSLKAEWIFDGGITIQLIEQLEQELGDKTLITLSSGKRERRIKITDDWKSEIVDLLGSRLTFIFRLFHYLTLRALEIEESENHPSRDDENAQLVFDLIDADALIKEYDEALHFFKSHLWHAEFDPVCPTNTPFRLKNGTLILQENLSQGRLDAISWEATPLLNLRDFLLLIGKINESLLMPIFSPEEEVFRSYFTFLSLAYEVAVPQPHLQPLILKAINNFFEENYTDAVSAIGLASEDVLTQVYETLYREQLTKGLTLGQLVDDLHAKATARFKRKDDNPPDLSALFPEIKACIDNPELSNHETAALLRKLLVLSIESQKHVNGRIEKMGKPEKKYSIFPDYVAHATNELIRYRNAAAHKSRIPIGELECRRAAHAFIMLMAWWLREKINIDWTMSHDEILKACIDRAAKN